MAMTLELQEDGRPLVGGQLIASAEQTWLPVRGLVPNLSGPASETVPGSGVWTIDSTPGVPEGFQVTLSYVPPRGRPFQPRFIPYRNGVRVTLQFVRQPPPDLPHVSHRISWTELDGRRLPDGDEIVLTTRSRASQEGFVALQTSTRVDWSKSIYVTNPVQRTQARLVATDAANQSRGGLPLAYRVGSPVPADRVAFAGLRLVLHKAKLLGTDFAMYELDLDAAPYLASSPTMFHFEWLRQ